MSLTRLKDNAMAFACVHMMYVSVCAFVHVGVDTQEPWFSCGGQRSVSGVRLRLLPCLRQSLGFGALCARLAGP